jgi:hypothetical protein
MNILTSKWTELAVLTLIVGLSIWTLLMYNDMTNKISDTWTACKTYYITQCDCNCNGRPISSPSVLTKNLTSLFKEGFPYG